MLALLDAVAALGLPDCWIGAGFVRNAVWDALHGRVPGPCSDIDVVWFDPVDARAERDAAIAAGLRAAHPDAPWDVKNQARMHERNGEAAPYRTMEDAISRWPETATAVAVRRRFGLLELIAPHGVDDLIGLVARPTPAFRGRADVVATRVREKGWQARWPRLRVLEC